MSCDSKGINSNRLKQFNKIRLLNDVANQIADYAFQCGNEQIFDYIDLNCGCIPDGEFGQVVDLDSPHQFLQMYMQIAENRFAFAVTSLLKMNQAFIAQLEEFCKRVGCHMALPKVNSLQEAYDFLDCFYLDGMPCDVSKEIISADETSITWKKLIENHEGVWSKAGGDINIFYHLLICFVDGLFEKSDLHLEIKENSIFRIRNN